MNYTGGKYALLPQIIPMFPERIDTFVDLFCGGCNVGVNINANHIILNDSMREIMDLYSKFSILPIEHILSHIENRISQFGLSKENCDGYYAMRKEYNMTRDPLDLFVCCAYSFSNQIRFNSKGEFNMPFGKRWFNERMRDNLIRFVGVLQKDSVELRCGSAFDFNFEGLGCHDLVYCDPPYLITTATYNENGGWCEADEMRLYTMLDDLNSKHIKFVLSNVMSSNGVENAILREWISTNENYRCEHLEKWYGNCSYHRKDKGDSDEVLVMNYIPDHHLEKQSVLE